MGTKKSVFISDDAFNFINERSQSIDDINFSESVSSYITTLETLYREALKTVDLTTDQWCVIFDIYAGSALIASQQTLHRIASDIMDHYGTVDIDRLEDRVKATVIKVAGYSTIEQLAIMDAVARFWANDWQGEKYSNYDNVVDYLTGKTAV